MWYLEEDCVNQSTYYLVLIIVKNVTNGRIKNVMTLLKMYI